MKLDLFNKQWLDIVFDGRNKSYGAYELRNTMSKTNLIALGIGTLVFSVAVLTPKISELFSKSSSEEQVEVRKVKLDNVPKKEEKKEIPKNTPPPPPPPPPVETVKFTKPVVAKKEDVTEDPPKVDDLKDKKAADKSQKADEDASLNLPNKYDEGPKKQEIVEEDNNVYSSAGVEVQPKFNGSFRDFLQRNFSPPDEPGLSGTVMVAFTVEKDGSLTDVKILKDIGYGAGAEAVKAIKKSPRWSPAMQNGKPVRCTFQQPFTIQNPEE